MTQRGRLSASAEQRRRYVDDLRRDGAPLDAPLASAFATVPREVFVADGFRSRAGTWLRPGDQGFLDTVYRDDVLVTKVAEHTPVSSSSQPSLMALMLSALDVRPGMRVLEIGAGTGYNAALLAALGAEVVSVDAQADVADRARAALDRAAVRGVRVVHGDGYAGAPGHRFDRVIVTVGVAGLSPHWWDQLVPDSFGIGPTGAQVIVPVQHVGTHPVLAVRGGPTGPVRAMPICSAGFMNASGPLAAVHPGSHPHPATARTMPPFEQVTGPVWAQPLGPCVYRDLWYAAGVWHRRATYAAVPGHDQGCLVLLDEDRTGGAAILPTGAVYAAGQCAEQLAADAAALVLRWGAEGAPSMQQWRITLARAGHPAAPLWLPARWELRSP